MAAEPATAGSRRRAGVEPVRAERTRSLARRSVRPVAAVLGGIVALAGLGLRLWTLGRAPINSDQAVVGLMAHEILHGHFFAFYWGQSYGGVEPYVTAALFGVFGQSSITLGLTAVLLDAVAALLLWRIGRRLFDPLVGIAAALLFWIWPEVYVHQSTIEYGFRWAALVLGLSMLLLALRLCDDPAVPRPPGIVLLDWVLLGACVGLGWWSTPEIAYYLLPTAVLLGFFVLRRGLRPGLIGAAGFLAAAVLGALPWLWDNVGHGFPSLHSAPQGPGNAGFVHHLRILFVHELPIVLGLRLRGVVSPWLFFAPLAKACYALVLAGIAVFCVLLAWRRRAVVLVVFAVLAPLVYADNPATWYWQDGRYALFLAPVISLLVVGAVEQASGVLRLSRLPLQLRLPVRRVAAAGLAIAAGLALTLAAVSRLAPYRPSPASGDATWTSWHADPNAYLLPTVDALVKAGTTHAYAAYWIGYDLAFEADGRLTVSDVGSFARYEPYLVSVESSERTAWLFPSATGLRQLVHETNTGYLEPACVGASRAHNASGCLSEAQLESYLQATHDPYRLLAAGDLVAVVPRYPAVADSVLASAGISGGIEGPPAR
jgi:4-amino-4-deoxy-L-arabinose transferase-like glycosyltransferase